MASVAELVRPSVHESMLKPQDVERRWFEDQRGTSILILGYSCTKGFLTDSAYLSSCASLSTSS